MKLKAIAIIGVLVNFENDACVYMYGIRSKTQANIYKSLCKFPFTIVYILTNLKKYLIYKMYNYISFQVHWVNTCLKAIIQKQNGFGQ